MWFNKARRVDSFPVDPIVAARASEDAKWARAEDESRAAQRISQQTSWKLFQDQVDRFLVFGATRIQEATDSVTSQLERLSMDSDQSLREHASDAFLVEVVRGQAVSTEESWSSLYQMCTSNTPVHDRECHTALPPNRSRAEWVIPIRGDIACDLTGSRLVVAAPLPLPVHHSERPSGLISQFARMTEMVHPLTGFPDTDGYVDGREEVRRCFSDPNSSRLFGWPNLLPNDHKLQVIKALRADVVGAVQLRALMAKDLNRMFDASSPVRFNSSLSEVDAQVSELLRLMPSDSSLKG